MNTFFRSFLKNKYKKNKFSALYLKQKMSYYKSSYLVDQQDNCEVIRLMFALVGHEYPDAKINHWLELNQRN